MTRSANTSRNFRIAVEGLFKKLELATDVWTRDVNNIVLNATPLDQGPLRQSMYKVKRVKYMGFVFETGFTEFYAPIVHEWTGPVNWTTPGTGPKYLQHPYYSIGTATLLPFLKRSVKL